MAITYEKVDGKLQETVTKTRRFGYTLAFIQEQKAKWTALETEAVNAGVTA